MPSVAAENNTDAKFGASEVIPSSLMNLCMAPEC